MFLINKVRFLVKNIFNIFLFFLLTQNQVFASTSWTGTSSTDWSTTGNWTNGVPTAFIDVIIGDASFTGSFQPLLTAKKSACLSLTIGNSTKICTLSLSNTNKNIVVSGNILIGVNGNILQSAKSTITLTGTWANSGLYNPSSNQAEVFFSGGSTQSITGVTSFQNLIISSGSTTTLNSNINIQKKLTVAGIFDPNSPSTYLVSFSGGASFVINNNGVLKVKASTFSANYGLNPTLSTLSIVDYSSTSINQTVAALSYGTLKISGGTIKTVAASFNVQTGGAGIGNINVTNGTLDLSTFTVNRAGTGSGALTVAIGCTLRLAGSFPANFSTYTLAPTSLTEYYGGNQTVYGTTYGNLTLSTSSGSFTKMGSATAITVAGNLVTSTTTTMNVLAGNNFIARGNVSFGANTTFTAGTFTHSIAGNLLNDGNIAGGSSTISMSGLNATISGIGAFNFFNLIIANSGITASSSINLIINGNLSTSGAGTFTQTPLGTGTVTMIGTGKAISGLGFSLDNLTISGTITTASDIKLNGNINVSGSLVCTLGTITFSGLTKTISNTGTLTFYGINIGSTTAITTTSSFSVSRNYTVQGSFSATSGTVTFTGTSILTGSPAFFNVTLNGTKLQLGNSSVLGIAGALTLTSGSFDVTTSSPNLVDYNSSGAQNVTGTTYFRIKLSGGSTKTATGAITVLETITINTSVTFIGGSFTHSVYSDWINNGIFTAGSSTVQFVGSVDSYITGATTFNNLTVNKSLNSTLVNLNNNVSVGTIAMTIGEVHTLTSTLTITITRTGSGVILGTITRSHAFTGGTAYEFESPFNTITFSTVSTVTSVTVIIKSGSISDFPFIASVLNREYQVNVTGVHGPATLRLHYLDPELNGNTESSLAIWKYSAGAWASVGKSGNDVVNNWVEYNLITDLNFRWTLCDGTPSVVKWNGSIDSDWAKAGNWTAVQGTPLTPPSSLDFVQLGVGTYTNQPIIATTVQIRGLQFNSSTPTTLTLSPGGSFNTTGSIVGIWSANANHNINIGAQLLTIGGNLDIGDGTANHKIDINATTGIISVGNDIVQKSAAAITFSGAGALNIKANYLLTSGTFACGTSTVTYNGTLAQQISPVTYNNLTINKASATATINSPIAINGNLTLSTGGQLDLISNITVGRNVMVNSGTILNAETSTIGVGGNWTQSGTYIQGSGTVNFNGSIDQNIGASTFANLTFNKPSGIAYATGDLSLNGNATLNSGTLNLGIFNLNRTALGGTLTLASGSTLYIGGSNNTPSNFDLESIAASSNVIYNGNAAQNVVKLGYGNLIFSNGNSLAKTISQPISVSGDFTINSGATVAGSSNTITLMGNWVSTGTFIPGTGTVIMSGVNKFISSNKSSFNNLTLIVGSIISSTAPSTTSVNGNFTNKGFFTQASDSIYLYGDFLNTGTVNLNGVTNIMGIAVQNFQNDGTLTSGLSGVVNFNGTVSPNTFSSTNASFSTLNINNTGVVAPFVSWSVGVAMNIGPGATFNGNGLTHNIAGSFSNNGTVLNDGGTFNFVPNSSRSINLGANFSCTGVVNFAGSNALSLSGTGNYTFGSVNVTNSNSAGIMATSDWNIAGTFFIKPGSIFHAGTARTINLQSNINVSGIFDGGSSTVVMQDTAAINGIGDINFNNLNIASKDSLLTDIKISGNFINNGDFYHNGYKVTFNGSGPSLISGTTTPIGFEDLAISKTADTTSLGCDITIGDTLIISSGSVLKGSTRTITISGNWIQDGTYTYNTSTTLFQGTVNQKITGLTGGSFYNLTIDNAGVEVSLGSNAKVQNLMTLTALSKFNSTGFEQIFVSNAKGTASLAALPAGAVFTGNIRMQRYLPPVSGRYWYQAASPVNNATVAMWQNGAPTNGFYVTGPFTGASAPVGVGVNSAGVSSFTWNSATALWSRFPVNSNTENIISKKGYRVLVRDGNPTYNSGNTAAKTFSVLGTPNTGNQTIALLYNATGGSPAGGWNFIGNPYPSNIDGDLSNSGWQTASANLASNATYTYNTSSGTYIVCNGGVGMCPIASSQGFWVKVNTGGGTLTATETVKTSTIQALRRVVPPTYTPIVLTSTQNLLSDITYLRFEDDATMGFDKQYDAYKLTMATPTAEAVPVLLSSFTNGIELSINARPVPTASDTIPLTVAVSDGNYQLDFSQKENLYGQYQMYLLDKFSKQTIDLKITPLYNFQVSKQDTSTTNKRFSVIFKNSNVITAVETDKNAFSSYLVFPNPVKDKIVKLRTPSNEKKVNIIITDLLGKEIYTGNEENNLNEVILKLNSYNITPGSYIITVKGQFSNFVQKLLFE